MQTLQGTHCAVQRALLADVGRKSSLYATIIANASRRRAQRGAGTHTRGSGVTVRVDFKFLFKFLVLVSNAPPTRPSTLELGILGCCGVLEPTPQALRSFVCRESSFRSVWVVYVRSIYGAMDSRGVEGDGCGAMPMVRDGWRHTKRGSLIGLRSVRSPQSVKRRVAFFLRATHSSGAVSRF